jgi:Flp pilus assembly protein TadD
MKFCLALALAVAPIPVATAQTPEALDPLVQAAIKPKDAMVLARSQVEAGALLEALATLDRTLATQPKAKEARLLHASILCRIDDRTGAAMEFGRLKSGDFKKTDWAAARAPCLTSPTAAKP